MSTVEVDRETLAHMWLCGFVSGAASAMATVMQAGGDEEALRRCDDAAERLAKRMRRSPEGMAHVRQEVEEILAGIYTEPRGLSLRMDGGT